MADDKPTTVLNIETLNTVSLRLADHADAMVNVAADLKLAAKIADRLADLRLHVAQIAAQALDRPQWDAAAFARDIRQALDEAGED